MLSTPDHTQWMVGLCSSGVFSKEQVGRSQLISLDDPSTQQSRQYILVQGGGKSITSTIVEVQSLASDFSSFFVGRHIVKDGALYVLNPVDPLFFVLNASALFAVNNDGSDNANANANTNADINANAKIPTQNRSSWQPLDQLLSPLPAPVQAALDSTQLTHVCQTLCNDQTDNLPYFKCSVDQALKWLHRKQERVYQALASQYQAAATKRRELQQQQQQQQQKTCSTRNHHNTNNPTGGSISATFHMPEDPMAAKPQANAGSSNASDDEQDDDVTSLKPSMAQQLKIESIQIVCSYLSAAWTIKLLESLSMCSNQVFGGASRTTDPNASTTTTTTLASTPKNKYYATSATDMATITAAAAVAEVTPKQSVKKIEASRSMGNKRLEKINKRGMTSLTSFFGPPKKKGKKSQ